MIGIKRAPQSGGERNTGVKGGNLMKKKLLLWLGVLMIVLAACGMVLLSVNKNSVIIRWNLRTLNALRTAAWVALGLGVLACVAQMIIQVRAFARVESAPQPTVAHKYEPAAIRSDLLRAWDERPHMQAELQKALNQMSDLDEKQALLTKVFARTPVAYMQQVTRALDEAEQSLCRRLTLLYSRVILMDPRSSVSQSKNKEGVEALLKTNQEVLDACDRLLNQIADGLNDAKGSSIDSFYVDSLTSAIHEASAKD
jgi:hypothetical protein